MPYKDPEKRRKASKESMRRKRVNPPPINPDDVNPNTIGAVNPVPIAMTVTPEGPKPEVPANYGLEDCECRHCQISIGRKPSNKVINHGAYKRSHELVDKEINRVSLPGDVDYAGFEPDCGVVDGTREQVEAIA